MWKPATLDQIRYYLDKDLKRALGRRLLDSIETHEPSDMAPATASTKHGGLDEDALPKLLKLLAYVDGDYGHAVTFQALKSSLRSAQRPAHYLAVPPSLFPTVIEQLARAGCAPPGAHVIVENPFGRDLESTRALNQALLGAFNEPHIFHIDQYLGREPLRT